MLTLVTRINGQSEMAVSFMIAGFTAIDVHMTDLLSGRETLSNYIGLAACGGFYYGIKPFGW